MASENACDFRRPKPPVKPKWLQGRSPTPEAQSSGFVDTAPSTQSAVDLTVASPRVLSERCSLSTSSNPATTLQTLPTSNDDASLYKSDLLEGSEDHAPSHAAEDMNPVVARATSADLPNFTRDASVPNSNRGYMGYTVPVLYKLACVEQTKRVNRYSDKPFEGVEPAKGRLNVSVMDVLDGGQGMFDTLPNERSRRNQSRELFGTPSLEDCNPPFKLGRDFIMMSSMPRSVRIMSKAVIKFIKQNLPYYSGSLPDEELVMQEPFKELCLTYHSFTKAIEDPASLETPSNVDDASAEISVGEKFVWELGVVRDWFRDNYYEKEIVPERLAHDKGFVTYQKLWLLFQPGTCVFMGEGDRTEFYIVQSVNPSHSYGSEFTTRCSIALWSLDFNGDRLIRRARATPVEVSEFSGQKEILRLPIIPFEYMSPKYMNDGRSPGGFIARGRLHLQLFYEACERPQLKQYSGALGGRKELGYSGAVIVDPLVSAEQATKTPKLGTVADLAVQDRTGDLLEPQDNDGGLKYHMLKDMSPSETKVFEDNEELYLLLTGRIWGFALGKNQWAQFDVMGFTNSAKSIDNNRAFDNLILEKKDIDLLKALTVTGDVEVGGGESVSFEQTDFVNGKALGKMILLHGPPGVGKSFTVECIAQYMRRPLLSLKMTDVGTDQAAEQKLSAWLDLAQRWNAVVLLDEADTFLEQRKLHDLDRNALVAAFLHVLEYFPGLIFWTSNLPAWLDDAVVSRFHLIIEYDYLTQKQREKIWFNFVEKSKREETARRAAQGEGATFPRLEIADDFLVYVSKSPMVMDLELNGREIRNAYQAAVRVAIQRAREDSRDGLLGTVTLCHRDVEKVLEKTRAFKKYLEEAYEASEALRAFRRNGRAPVRKKETRETTGIPVPELYSVSGEDVFS